MRPFAALAVVSVGCLGLSGLPASAGARPVGPARSAFLRADPDTYRVRAGHVLDSRAGVLANDRGDVKTLVRHTEPAHGTLTLRRDGTFRYVPAAGFAGKDSFTYTLSDAVKLYSTHLAPLAVLGGVPITAGGYGSSLYPVPGHPGEFYGLTDRGPNVGAPDGNKVEPIPAFDPAIAKFRLVGTKRCSSGRSRCAPPRAPPTTDS